MQNKLSIPCLDSRKTLSHDFLNFFWQLIWYTVLRTCNEEYHQLRPHHGNQNLKTRTKKKMMMMTNNEKPKRRWSLLGNQEEDVVKLIFWRKGQGNALRTKKSYLKMEVKNLFCEFLMLVEISRGGERERPAYWEDERLYWSTIRRNWSLEWKTMN